MLSQDDAIKRAQEVIDYRFDDERLLSVALTHASIADHRLLSNERQEFLGDSVLGLIVCDELYRRYPNQLEGEMTMIKSVVVSRKICAEIAASIGLSDLLFLGKGISDRKRIPLSLKAAAFESIIAAIYLDGGFEAARRFVLPHVDRFIDAAADSDNQHNFKSHLQQYAQQYLAATPQYETLDEQGPDHNKCFEVCVSINGQRFPSAWGSSKKEAEQRAAMRAMEEIKTRKTPQA